MNTDIFFVMLISLSCTSQQFNFHHESELQRQIDRMLLTEAKINAINHEVHLRPLDFRQITVKHRCLKLNNTQERL